MDNGAIKEIIYGGVTELMKNRKYYYRSAVSSDYCHWTDEGKEAVCQFLNLLGPQINRNEEEDLKQRSKDMIIKGLKGEKV